MTPSLWLSTLDKRPIGSLAKSPYDSRYVTTKFSPGLALRGWWTQLKGGKRMVALAPWLPSVKDQVLLRDLLEAGRIKTVIDRRLTPAELPEALGWLQEGHTRGKLIIVI
jgi:NADPH:quinone reductase-like Zn-dependent oxidoreductase